MKLSLLFYAVLGMGVASLFVWAINGIRRQREPKPIEGLRFKWIIIAFVAWIVGGRVLSTEYVSVCTTPLPQPRVKGGYGDSNFFDCSPQLLAAGPVEVFLFFWTWVPMVLAGFLFARYLLRVARQRTRNSKES